MPKTYFAKTDSRTEGNTWPPKPKGQSLSVQQLQEYPQHILILGWISLGLSLPAIVFACLLGLHFTKVIPHSVLVLPRPFMKSCGPAILVLGMPLLSIFLGLFSQRFWVGKVGWVVASLILITTLLWPVT
jgi:hypothetical protein